MNETDFDIDAYCRRIGFTGAPASTLETLRGIHRLHPQAIAFETLDVLLRRPVRLDAESLQRKLVQAGRGGYCLEHNKLLSYALKSIGFTVTELTARARYLVPDGVPMPLTHMLLLVDLDGVRYIADVGFSGNTATAPLRLDTAVELATSHEPFRVIPAADHYMVQIKLGGVWTTLHNFRTEPQHQPDLDVGNWYMSTCPQSRFYNDLAASRVTPEGRLALNNNQLAIHRLDGASERRVLGTASELREALADLFKIRLAGLDGLDAALGRLTAGAG